MTATVRAAVEDDVAAIAEIRVRSWQAAYRGILPQGYLDGLRPEADADRRRGYFADPDAAHRDHVAELDGRVVGWLAVGPYRQEDAPSPTAGEVYALYVHPEHWGRGIGRTLMRHAVEVLAGQQRSPTVLWVLADNARAREFYHRMGFRWDGARQLFELGGSRLAEVRYRQG